MSRSCVTRAAQTSSRAVTTNLFFFSYRTAYVTYPASRKALIITNCIQSIGPGGCGNPKTTTTYVTYPGSTATSLIPVTITSRFSATYVTTLTTTSCTTVSTRPPSSSRPPSTSPIYNPPPPSTSPIYYPPPSSSRPPSSRPPSSRPPSSRPPTSRPPTPRPPPPTTVISTVVVPPPTPSTSNLLSTGSPSTSFDTPTSSSRPQVTVSRLDATEPTDSFPSPTIDASPAATTTSSSTNVAHVVGFGVGGVAAAVLLGLVFYHFILPKVGSLFGLKAAKSVALHRVVRGPDFDNDFNQHDQTENGQGNIQVQDIQMTRRVPTQNAYHNHQGYAIDGLNYTHPNQVTMPQVAGGYPSGSGWGTNAQATGYPGSVPVAAAGHNIGPTSYTTSLDSSSLSATSAVQNGLHRHQSYTGSGSPDSAQLAMMRSVSLFPGQYTGYAEPQG